MTDLVRTVIRMNATVQKSGEYLTRGMGLTNARWQTLAELFALEKRVTVSELARHMGLTRQAVQRLADDMASDGLIEFAENPGDARAMHLLLTEAGRATYHEASEREWQWTNIIVEGDDFCCRRSGLRAGRVVILHPLSKRTTAMPTVQETTEQAKAAYLHSTAQLRSAFAYISEEKLNWSPSPTARTPVQIVAHAAQAVNFIHQQMSGVPFRHKTTAEADAAFRDWERQFDSREQVIGLLEEVSVNYLNWLDGLTQERLETITDLPFGLGAMPVESWLAAAPAHTQFHTAQLEYIQTICDDRDWHP